MLTWSPYTSTPSLESAALTLEGGEFSNKLTTTCTQTERDEFLNKIIVHAVI
jgi:hypothetical protein